MQICLLTTDSGLVMTVRTVDYSNILLSVPTTNTNWSKYKQQNIRRVNIVGLSAFITICHLRSSGKVENTCEESVGECTTVACAKTGEMYLGCLADSLSLSHMRDPILRIYFELYLHDPLASDICKELKTFSLLELLKYNNT